MFIDQFIMVSKTAGKHCQCLLALCDYISAWALVSPQRWLNSMGKKFIGFSLLNLKPHIFSFLGSLFHLGQQKKKKKKKGVILLITAQKHQYE